MGLEWELGPSIRERIWETSLSSTSLVYEKKISEQFELHLRLIFPMALVIPVKIKAEDFFRILG